MKNVILSIAVVAAALIASGCHSDNSQPGIEIANSYLAVLIAGDPVGPYNEGALEFRRRTTFEDFRLEALQLRPAPAAKVTWTETKTEGDKIKFLGEVPRAESSPAKVSITLVNELGTWRMFKFDVTN